VSSRGSSLRAELHIDSRDIRGMTRVHTLRVADAGGNSAEVLRTRKKRIAMRMMRLTGRGFWLMGLTWVWYLYLTRLCSENDPGCSKECKFWLLGRGLYGREWPVPLFKVGERQEEIIK